ncbi:MAG: TolB family protein, partial [Planctomycetota bacterium]
ADGMSLLFVRGRAGGSADIYVADRTPRGWTEPRPLEGINTEADELGPEPSPDGRTVYFYSDRAGGAGGYDLWLTRREGDGWSEPVNLGPGVNGPYHDYGPAVTPDGAGLYFASNRPRPDSHLVGPPASEDASPLAIREDMEHRDYDLYLSAIGEDGAGAAEPLTALNSDRDEVAPAVSPGGDFLYFCSDRDGGLGGFDILRSRRLRGGHEPASNLGPSLNTSANELDPAVAMGGFGLYFTSDRADDQVPAPPAADDAGDDAAPAGASDRDLYFAASREVFTETEVQRAAVDWWAIWSAVWPLLLWLLLIALLWLALAKLGERERLGRLSLLARCLLASLLIHALLMLVLTAVNVTTSLSELMRDRSGTRVALVSPSASAAGDLAAQIRGSLTDIEIQVSQDASSQRQEQAVEPEPSSAMATLTVQRSTIEARPEPPQPAAADDAPAPATTPTVQTASAERQPSPVPVELPAQPERVRATEAAAETPVRSAQASRAPSEPQRSASESASSAATSVELAVSPSDLTSDARLNQPLHDAGQTPDAQTPPTTATAAAAPAQPMESAVPTLDIALPSASDAPTERVAEAQVTVAAQAAAAVRQRTSAAERAVTSTQVNVSPQPVDQPLAQGSLAVADARPAAASPAEPADDHRRGLTALVVQPSPSPAMPAMPEAAAGPAGEPVTDAATVAASTAPRRSSSPPASQASLRSPAAA